MNRWKMYTAVLIVIAIVGATAIAFANMTQSEFCDDASNCSPTGAHGKAGSNQVGHVAYVCVICHSVGGTLAFQPGGAAFITGGAIQPPPRPYFDASAKTCSNIACHAMPAGTFSYYFPDGTGEPALNTVSYGGGAPQPTPSWYALGAVACRACHGDPPANGSTGSNTWHSGYHGGQGPTGARNQCQFCHPDASSPGNGIGDTITNPSLHANGAVNVQATFTSACFGCH